MFKNHENGKRKKNKRKKKEDITGSIVYQIDDLEKQVELLKIHLEKNKTLKNKGNQKDVPAKRALLKKVAKIKRFRKYLKQKN